MVGLTHEQQSRLARYNSQSVRLLRDAMNEARQARWLRTEELLWGSVTLAVKSVALTRGDVVDDRRSVEEYAKALGQENNDRRIRDAFSRLSTFADVADRMRDSRGGAQQLVSILEDVAAAVERLWEMIPVDEPPTSNLPESPEVDDEPVPPPRRRNARRRQRRTDSDDDD